MAQPFFAAQASAANLPFTSVAVVMTADAPSAAARRELALDRYEGYPHFYYKTELELPLAETGKKLTAFVYIMSSASCTA